MGVRGIPMIMTRPEEANEAFVATLPHEVRAKVDVVFSPLISIVATGAVPEVDAQDGVVFTSANGVRFSLEGDGRRAFCVGRATTQAAVEAGWDAEYLAPDAAGLVAALSRRTPDMRLHHLCGVHARGEVAERLGLAGWDVDRVALYDQQLLPLTDEAQAALKIGPQVIVPLFSPRTASQFALQCRHPAHVHAIALSPAIANALEGLPVARLEIAGYPTSEEVCALVEKAILSDSLG